jgi:transposase
MAAGKKNAARRKAWLIFIDEAGFLMAPLVRRSWAPCGQTPILHQRTRSHQKVSVIGALAVSPTRELVRCFFRLHPNENIIAPLIVAFLRQLARHIDAPMTVIWDRLQGHRGKAVQAFLRAHPTVRSELLPPYAPELNPIEYAWGYLKSNPLANLAPADCAELTRKARTHVRSLKRNQRVLRSFVQHSPLSLRLK